MDPALQAMRAHEEAVDAARAAGTELPHITFPTFGPAPDGGKQEKGGKGKGPSGSGQGGPNPWGNIGDKRPSVEVGMEELPMVVSISE
jgi:hypothetical protein